MPDNEPLDKEGRDSQEQGIPPVVQAKFKERMSDVENVSKIDESNLFISTSEGNKGAASVVRTYYGYFQSSDQNDEISFYKRVQAKFTQNEGKFIPKEVTWFDENAAPFATLSFSDDRPNGIRYQLKPDTSILIRINPENGELDWITFAGSDVTGGVLKEIYNYESLDSSDPYIQRHLRDGGYYYFPEGEGKKDMFVKFNKETDRIHFQSKTDAHLTDSISVKRQHDIDGFVGYLFPKLLTKDPAKSECQLDNHWREKDVVEDELGFEWLRHQTRRQRFPTTEY